MNLRIKQLKLEITHNKICHYNENLKDIKLKCSKPAAKNLDILSEKGSSSWFGALPLKEYGFILNTQEFIDSILLRYNHPMSDIPKICACSSPNNIDHALICKRVVFSHSDITRSEI